MADSLQALYDERIVDLEARHAEARTTLEDTRKNLQGDPYAEPPTAGARANCRAAVAACVDNETAIAALRERMAAAPMHADAEEALDELYDQLLARRRLRRRRLDAEEALDEAEREHELARKVFLRLRRQLAAAAETAAETETRAARLTGLADQLGEEPLATLPGHARALVDATGEEEPYPRARARLESELPDAALRDRAVARRQAELDRIADLRTALEPELAAGEPVEEEPEGSEESEERSLVARLSEGRAHYRERAAEAARRRARLSAAEDAFSDHVLRAAERCRYAVRRLERIADDPERITDAEAARLDECRQAVLEAGLPEATETELTPEARRALEHWEVAVPPHVWSHLGAFHEAEAILRELAAADPTALREAVEEREEALVEALEAEEESRRAVELLNDEVERQRGRLAFAETTCHRRLESALCGEEAEEPEEPTP